MWKKWGKDAKHLVGEQGVAEGSDGWIGNPAKWKEAVLQAHGPDVTFKNYSHPGQPGKRSVNAINAQGKQVGVYQRHNKMGMVQPNQQGVAEGVPQPGKSSGKPISWIDPTKVVTKYLTLDEIFKSVSGIPYYNNVVTDRDNKDFTWGVTKRVIQYAKELVIRPDAYKNWPPIIVLDGKLQDGAHRISTIYLMQQRVQSNNPIWKNAKLKVEFGTSDNVKQGVAEGGYSGIDDTDTVGFSVNSERAYNAVMARFGDQIDHDETSGILYVPARMWPKVEMVAFDADGEGATQADGSDQLAMDEGKKVGNMDADAFDAAMSQLKQLAGAGPMKTVYDPVKRVYKNVPQAEQPKKPNTGSKTVSESRVKRRALIAQMLNGQ
jgi:hypothetical protein